jgi:hypothetical protein
MQGQLLIATIATTLSLRSLLRVTEEKDGVLQATNGFLTTETLNHLQRCAN